MALRKSPFGMMFPPSAKSVPHRDNPQTMIEHTVQLLDGISFQARFVSLTTGNCFRPWNRLNEFEISEQSDGADKYRSVYPGRRVH